MKYKLFLFVIAVCLTLKSQAQTGVAINATGAEPDGSAMLDVSSTEKGMLIPRMTLLERNAITTPAEGLMIFQTDEATGFYYYQSSWKFVGTSLDYNLLTNKPGNATTATDGFMSAADKTKLDATATGTAPGQMQYWNGTSWIPVAAGQEGQFLRYSNSTPVWVTLTEVDLLNIGDSYQGGVIAYFLQPGDPGYDADVRHGIIAAPDDQSTSTVWGCFGYEITGADSTALGTGAQNTLDIVAGCSTAGIAAQICNDLILNGYDDWYLPSKDELYKLYLNKTAIGGFASAYYWSSSEYSYRNAWLQSFFNGFQIYNFIFKNDLGYVRAVRSF